MPYTLEEAKNIMKASHKPKPTAREYNNAKYKVWYEENKERKKKYLHTLVTCECGMECKRGYISIHRKTKKHSKRLEENKLEKEHETISTCTIIDDGFECVDEGWY